MTTNKLKGYWIYLRHPDGHDMGYSKVWGKGVTISGFENYDFFATQSKVDNYCITEGKTGYAVAYGQSIKFAIAETEKLFNNTSREKLDASITNAINIHGVSPRWGDKRA